MHNPPRLNRYQLSRFNRGKATSRAPTIIGTKKFPSTVGIEGIRKKKTMMIPCIENILLYVSDETRSPGGVIRSSRISSAKKPPKKKKSVIETRESSPMRL